MASEFHGDRLRLARQFHGFSLTELGERVSASRQYLHQLETAEKLPTSEMRAALAQALAVDFYFFSSPLSNPVRIETDLFSQAAKHDGPSNSRSALIRDNV